MAVPFPFVSGAVLTAAQLNAITSLPTTAKTASATLTAAESVGYRVTMTSASATTITINTGVYATGDTVFITNLGTGICTVTAGTATVSSAGSLAIPQYGSGVLVMTATGTGIWYPSAVTTNGYLAATQKYGTTINIVSSTTETDILQASGYSIPANTLGANGNARVTIQMDYINNTGGALTMPTMRAYFGGTKILDTGAGGNQPASAVRQAGKLTLDLQNLNATNSQICTMGAFFSAQGVTTGSGGGNWSGTNGAGDFAFNLQNTAAIDTTAAATLRVTAQLSSSSSSHQLRAFASMIEFV